MNIKDVVSLVTSPADMAAGMLGYALGFGVDVFGFPGGTEPGATAGVFAVGALGVKNLAVTAYRHYQSKRAERNKEVQGAQNSKRLAEKAQTFLRHLKGPNHGQLRSRLRRELELWRKGLTSDSDFEKELQNMIAESRAQG